METKHIVITILIIAIAIVGYSIYHGFNKTTISTQGTAEITADPEYLVIYFQAQYEADTASEASQEVAEIIEDLKINLYRAGISEENIQTENYNVRQKYRYEDSEEYIATQTLSVKTKKFYNAGKMIDAGVNAGALVNYINFEISQEKQNELKAEALEKAAEDAKIKAEALASGSGKKLGKLVRLGDSGWYYNDYRLYAAEAGGTVAEAKQAVTNISPKELTVRANVNAVYEIY